jgi:Mn2+/Fe2+ NRAMP family transporter
VVGLGLVVWVLSFEWIERIFGYGGLCLLVFAVAAYRLEPDWGAVARGFVPSIDTTDTLVFLFFAVGLLGAAMTPYEVYFYSSGGVEEEWTSEDLGVNRANAIAGFGLGGVLSFFLMIVGGALFLPNGVEPEALGTVSLASEVPLGTVGLLVALAGIFFAVSGAAIDTLFAGAYNLAQFFGWEWGRYRTATGAPSFTVSWLVLLLIAGAVVMTGVDPIKVTEYAVIFSVVALPLTYLPILLVANDRAYMGDDANGRFANALGIAYFIVIMVVSVSAIPLLLLTNVGQG